MTITVEVKGLPQLERNMAKYSEEVRKNLDDAIQRGALHIQRDAKINCPVDTGRLRNSIQYAPTGEAEAEVYTDVNYAAHVEFGTSKQRAQPYIRPAVDANSAKIVAEVKAAIKNANP